MPVHPGGGSSRSLASLVVLGAAVAAAFAGGAVAAKGPGAEPRNLTLRLADAGPGYLVGNDSGCNLTLFDEGVPRSVERLAIRHAQRNCRAQFQRLWVRGGESPGPPLVESFAFVFSRTAGAEAGFEVRRDLIAYSLGLPRRSLTEVGSPRSIGDALAVFETDDALVGGRPRRSAVVAVWRTGRVLSLVLVGGRSGPSGVEDALRLADIQQARIETPTALRPRENDDRTVPLDNPRLGVPVYWLGHRFRPSRHLPRLVLEDSFGPLGRFTGPGWRAEIEYGATGRGAGVTLGLWRPRAFARFRRSRLGRLVRTHRCARARRLDLSAGRAVIYAGYASPPKRCGQAAPDRYLAHVFLDGVVVSVNVPACFLCVEPLVRRDPYNTLRGMKAVIKRLQLR